MKKRLKKATSVDRRIQKTKKLLTDALVELIVEKGYQAVTVKDIIERANVGRSTFYAHFEDKDQLLLSGHDAFKRILSADFLSPVHQAGKTGIDFLYLYRHVYERRDLATAMGTQGEKILHDHLRELIAHGIEESFRGRRGTTKDRTMYSLTVDAAAAAMVTFLFRWIQEGMPASPEIMAKDAENLLLKMMG